MNEPPRHGCAKLSPNSSRLVPTSSPTGLCRPTVARGPRVHHSTWTATPPQSARLSSAEEIRYVIPGNTIVAIHVHTQQQAQAVEAVALESSFRILLADEGRSRNVVYHCTARNHPGGEVLWS